MKSCFKQLPILIKGVFIKDHDENYCITDYSEVYINGIDIISIIKIPNILQLSDEDALWIFEYAVKTSNNNTYYITKEQFKIFKEYSTCAFNEDGF